MMKSGHNRLMGAGGFRWFVWLACFQLFFELGSPIAVQAGDLPASPSSQLLTNITQFRERFSENDGVQCPFHLIGVVTMVDTGRNLFVLQDDTGAMAVHLGGKQISLQPGQLISLQGTSAAPYFDSFPDYPYQPSGHDLRNSLEAPSNWGEYHLTRMRGYLHPPATGDYTFWIASDNSSELWLSPDDEPAKAKRIALIRSGDWVGQHVWNRYPSQHSETINLSAGKTYYIEAVSEQLSLDENLAVAWQGPDLDQSVIDGRYLTPWVESPVPPSLPVTNGVLREYWTNYTLGNVVGIVGRKSFTSIFTLKDAQVAIVGQGKWPEPQSLSLDQPLLLENNYHWSKVRGTINFVGVDGDSAVLELVYNRRKAEVRVSRWNGDLPNGFRGRQIQVEGVCEGMQTANGYLMPGLIWAPTRKNISFLPSTNSNQNFNAITSPDDLGKEANDPNNIWSSYVSIRGVVTFNDRVFGRDFLFIQDDAAGINILQGSHHFNQLQVGQWIEAGGTLMPGGYSPDLVPIQVTVLGRRPMPQPETQPIEIPVAGNRIGQWTELEGVIHAINTNGTLVMVGKKGRISLWLGQTSKDDLAGDVDATLRVRGVLTAATENDPMLLVPSRSFVEVEDKAPEDSFGIPSVDTSEINAATLSAKWIHRVKVKGVVIFRNGQSLFVQDAHGGLRGELLNDSPVKTGDTVEMVGFPEVGNRAKTLTEALVHVVGSDAVLNPLELNLNQDELANYSDTLVGLEAKILTQKTKGTDQIMDLQAGQRFYEAILPLNYGQLPVLEPGSRLKVVGVFGGRAGLAGKKSTTGNDLSEPAEIFLRGPQDVMLLQGPPWWTLKGFLLLTAILLTVIITGLLMIYTLRRRLERQRLAKLIFSRQILQSQEEERHRIAVNLHDTLGQNLLIIKNQSHLAMQLPADESVVRHRLNEISEVTIQAIEEVRQITRNLRPYQLDRLGLTHAIRAIIKQVAENSPILFASMVDEIDGAFDKESEIHVYRIVQEGINNIIKHSRATEATIVVKKHETMVSLSIRDNGQGFDVVLNKPAGFGLNSLIERVWILGGESKIVSSPGGGTNLIFEIPRSNS